MAKQLTNEDVATAASKAASKAEAKGTKTAMKSATDKVKAQIDRVKASDLGKAEKKAAVAALQATLVDLKTPLPAA